MFRECLVPQCHRVRRLPSGLPPEAQHIPRTSIQGVRRQSVGTLQFLFLASLLLLRRAGSLPSMTMLLRIHSGLSF
jgi:hypothetical protein